jgi:hypothetical protein
MMKKALIPLLAIAAASVAVPAAAQNYDRHDRGDRYEQNRGGWQSISNRKFQLDRRIDVGLRNGSLSRREASRLSNQLDSLIRLERNYLRVGPQERGAVLADDAPRTFRGGKVRP